MGVSVYDKFRGDIDRVITAISEAITEARAEKGLPQPAIVTNGNGHAAPNGKAQNGHAEDVVSAAAST